MHHSIEKSSKMGVFCRRERPFMEKGNQMGPYERTTTGRSRAPPLDFIVLGGGPEKRGFSSFYRLGLIGGGELDLGDRASKEGAKREGGPLVAASGSLRETRGTG